jgi:Ca2+-transporting ATPase
VGLTLFGHYFQVHSDPVEGRSIAFASFAVNSMVYIFAYRSLRRSLFHSGKLSRNKPLVITVAAGLLVAFAAFAIPPVRELLQVNVLHLADWAIVLGVALGMLGVVEVGKAINNVVHRWREGRGMARSA